MANEIISSGEVVRNDQQATVSNSRQIAPTNGLMVLANGRVQLPPETNSGSNAILPETGPRSIDSGTNGALRPIVETQSTPLGVGTSNPVPFNEDAVTSGKGIVPNGSAGVGSGNEDKGGPTGAGTSAIVSELNSIDAESNLPPKGNPLDQYSSYTYQASLYLMTKDNYQRMVNTGQKNLSGAKLIVQSGGININDRADNFDVDYYIDRLELKSFFAGKATRLAHNVKEVRMTVVEPNGITFIDNIDATVQKFLGGATEDKKKNFTSQIYLLTIRFFGYDEKGNLIRSGTVPGQSAPNSSATNSGAIDEKWYPLILTKVSFKVASKLVEYDVEFKAPPYYINASSGRGSIPFNVELSGGTLKDILAGPVTYAAGQNAATANQTSATQQRTGVNLSNANAGGGRGGPTSYQSPPPKADAANTPKKTVRQGLMAALNEYQKDLVNQGIYQFADEYNVEFALDSMASATILNPGLNKGATSMAVPATAGDQKLGTKQSMDPKSRVEGVTAGMQIVQFIDTLVRNSSYIRDQQLLVIDEKTGDKNPTGAKLNNTFWYKVGFHAEAMMDKYDEKRNDYAYKITYVVSPFLIRQLNSPYFQVPKPATPHKSYQYWFTGTNSQVISYEETLNSLYYVVLSGANLGGATSNANELLKYQYQTASGQTTMGADGKTLEPAANAADQLYSPSDLKECVMTIVGDPDWLEQGESFIGLSKKEYTSRYLSDGRTINSDSQQILFDIGYNKFQDYNVETGYMAVGPNNQNSISQQDQQIRSQGTNQITRRYIAKECISEFNKGKFTQTLKGSLMIYHPQQKIEGKSTTPTKAAVTGAKTVTKAPAFVPPRSSVTDPTPTSALAKGTQQILNPAVQADNPSLSQLQASPVYIQARRDGATPTAALDAARSAFAAGTNNAANFAAPGIRTGPQKIVKDSNPG